MMGIRLNAQVTIKNLQNAHENFEATPPTVTVTRAQRRMDPFQLRVSGLGPPARHAGDQTQAGATTTSWGGGCGSVACSGYGQPTGHLE